MILWTRCENHHAGGWSHHPIACFSCKIARNEMRCVPVYSQSDPYPPLKREGRRLYYHLYCHYICSWYIYLRSLFLSFLISLCWNRRSWMNHHRLLTLIPASFQCHRIVVPVALLSLGTRIFFLGSRINSAKKRDRVKRTWTEGTSNLCWEWICGCFLAVW